MGCPSSSLDGWSLDVEATHRLSAWVSGDTDEEDEVSGHGWTEDSSSVLSTTLLLDLEHVGRMDGEVEGTICRGDVCKSKNKEKKISCCIP